jgi:hypothetical protein
MTEGGAMNLELNEPDGEMLKQILTSYLSDLRMEISGTDLKDYRDKLKNEELFLKDVIARLSH